MWEEYLDQSTESIVNKYHARRVQAKIRHQLLSMREELIGQGYPETMAMALAMQKLGDPRRLSERYAVADRRQRGFLWLLSLTQMLFGLTLLAGSIRTESFAALALGRVVTLWGVISTSIHSLNQQGLKKNLTLLRSRWRLMVTQPVFSGWVRMMGIGGISGILAALVGGLPWNFVTTNMMHPVLLSESMSFFFLVLAVWLPWIGLRRLAGTAFWMVPMQAWASLSATVAYTGLLIWHASFVPPPFFNWQPILFMVGSWVFNFAALRALTFIMSVRERVDPWSDDEFRSAI